MSKCLKAAAILTPKTRLSFKLRGTSFRVSNLSMKSREPQKQRLVGGFNHLEKYESQWEGLSHILWKIKAMFETTNQKRSMEELVVFVAPAKGRVSAESEPFFILGDRAVDSIH